MTFKQQAMRSYFLNEYTKDKKFMEIGGNPIKFSKANKPQDIYWDNLIVTT